MLGVRREELKRALLAFAILFLVLASYTVIKAVRDAVFLSRFGVTQISLVSIVLAAMSGAVVALFLRATAKLAGHWLATVTYLGSAGVLVALWLALQSSAFWVPWALYVASSLFGVFLVMQFWQVASELFDVREAKRVFGAVGAGAILGGLAGGFAAQLLATRWSAANLLLCSAALLVIAAGLVHVVWPLRPPPDKGERSEGAAAQTIWSLLARPSLMRWLAIGLLLSTVATTLIDWQVKAIAKHAFASDADGMTSFFGALFAYQSIAALAVQIVLTSWLLGRLGLGTGRMVLPVTVALGCFAIVGHASLGLSLVTAAAVAKVSEGGLRFAVDRAAVELSWLPLPTSARMGSKTFVDTVFDRLGTGATGALWLLMALGGLDQPDRVRWISLVVVGVVVLWIAALAATQRAYVDAFRKSLASRAVDLMSLRANLGEAGAMKMVTDALRSKNADQARFGLYLLEDSDTALPDLEPALRHKAAHVRSRALRLLTRRLDAGYHELAVELLEDAEHAVSEAAIVYLRSTGGAERAASRTSESGEIPFSQSVVALGNAKLSAEAVARIRADLATGGDRVDKIHMLGAAPAEPAALLLEPLLSDADHRAATAAIRAAGRAKAVGLVDRLAACLADAHRRPAAMTALADIGAVALDRLIEQLRTPATPLPVRRALVRLAGGSRHGAMAAELEPLLDTEPPELSLAAAHALSRLRAGTRVVVHRDRIERLLLDAGRTLYRRLVSLGRGAWPLARAPQEEEDLLGRALREAADAEVHRIFWLLTLLYDPNDMRSCYRGLMSPLRPVRARSLELLDNLLKGSLRAALLPPLEELDAAQLEASAQAIQVRREGEQALLRGLLSGSDPWLSLVACWTIGTRRLAGLRKAVAPLAKREDELGGVARKALQALDGQDDPENMALTQVEKALKLRAVDVLKEASSEDLAYVAQIASELTVAEKAFIYQENEAPDALYVVITGEVELVQGDVEIGVASAGETIGTWALVDDAPRVASARARTACTLLKVGREDFTDLLADRPDIVQAIFKAMVYRIRNLADLARGEA